MIEVITKAGKERRLLEITYLDAKDKQTVRTVEPYEIKNRKLYAFCRIRNAIRSFDTFKIVQAVLQDDTYDPRFEVKL